MMTDAEATLGRIAEDMPVGAAPLEVLLLQGQRANRRRRSVLAGVAGSVALVVGAAVVAGGAPLSSDRPGTTIAQSPLIKLQVRGAVQATTDSLNTDMAAIALTAVWHDSDKTLSVVSSVRIDAGLCVPHGSATLDGSSEAVALTVSWSDSEDGCAAPGLATFVITGLSSRPTMLTLREGTEVREVTVTDGELIAVTTDDGLSGYAYLDDMSWAPATSPQEAQEQTTNRLNRAGELVVPVYLADGKTQIGEFTAGRVD